MLNCAVVVFPGSNREGDMARVLDAATRRAPTMLWHDDHELPSGTDLVVLPGGFSYGDYLRCGAIAGRTAIMDAVRAHAARGGLVLGVCNGFQILCESGLLPGVLDAQRQSALRLQDAASPGRARRHGLHAPLRQGPDDQGRDRAWRGQLRSRMTRRSSASKARGSWPSAIATPRASVGGEANPNGSRNDIAGIYSPARNVLGLMPHPENLIDPLVGGVEGLGLFESLAAALNGIRRFNPRARPRRASHRLPRRGG